MTDTIEARAAALAHEPLRLASPRAGFMSGTVESVRDIMAHRELLGLLVSRELKARYKDSSLGFMWSLIRPLVMLLIYYIALGKFLGAARGIPAFAIFIYSGLTAWTLYSEIVALGTASIVGNAGLIKKIYLPREVFPLSVVGSSLFNFSMQFVILMLATAGMHQIPTGGRWLYFPLSLVVLVVWALAVALLLSAVNVYLRDVGYLVEIALQVMFWASPIVYSWQTVLGHVHGTFYEPLYLSNPMTLVAMGFQKTFWVAGDKQVFPPQLGLRLGITLAIGLILLWLCQRVFARLQANFAQEL
ncbi:teichoic acid translocation permease protein TagG [mine drainage metagenome]|uniref:Teichoic acid translocation permease protein TagG n=1 Tax=mine drainage metagenome TaxID=410659 RepID=A0A1J5RN43_9ZZZZ